MMMKVVYGLIPCVAGSLYFFGWRALLVLGVVLLAGILAEGAFTWRAGKPVSSAVFVTSIIFTLSLPPTVPLWIAVVGVVFGVVFGKMAFGGMGHNVYNPAMAGRCFIYVAFPVAMTSSWVSPFASGAGGLASFVPDAVTSATPLRVLYQGGTETLAPLFFGNVSGSLGETSVLLILAGGIYILVTKAANWRLFAASVIGGLAATGVLMLMGQPVAGIPAFLLAGSFLFGAFFVVTEPISGPKTNEGRWIYGILVGALIIVLRRYSNFAEGVMFAVLFGNTFVPILDIGIRALKARKKATAKA